MRRGAARRREIPASLPGTQPRNRKWRDVNAPEGLRRRLYSVNDRGTNHGRVRNNDRALIPRFAGEPFSHPKYEVCNGFAAVRCSRGIAQPGRNRIRLARLHFVKPATRPASIVQSRNAGSTFAFNPKTCAVCRVRSSGLCPTPAGLRQCTRECSGARRTRLIKRLVRREACRAHGIRRAMRDKNQPSGHCRIVAGTSGANYVDSLPTVRARWVRAPNSKPSVAHMISCAPNAAIRNCHSTTAGNPSGTSFTAGRSKPARVTMTM